MLCVYIVVFICMNEDVLYIILSYIDANLFVFDHLIDNETEKENNTERKIENKNKTQRKLQMPQFSI